MATGYNERSPGSFYPSSPPTYHSDLPIGTYSVNYNSCLSLYYLKKIDDFKISDKIYGDVTKNSNRILKTFLNRENTSTGVLLCGQKGSGKTLTTKHISIQAATEWKMPTLVVNSAYSGDEFNNFIQGIDQPCVVIFDEYEKVYSNPRRQEGLLTLFDGVYPSKKLFLLTSNDKKKVGKYLMNRPGRLFYVIDFHGINWELISAYLAENLKDKTQVDTVLAISVLMSEPNFDMIKALVEEMNRYEESPVESLQYLNIRPQFNEELNYKATVVHPDGKSFNTRWSGNPMTDEMQLDKITMTMEYFMKVDAASKSLIFVKDGYTVKLKNCPETEFSWSKFGAAYSGDWKVLDDKSNVSMNEDCVLTSSTSEEDDEEII